MNSFPGEQRRASRERRRRIWWSLLYGNVQPRRRGARREIEARFHPVDWHQSRLLAVALCILVLCVIDAFLTLVLLRDGARELNPIMAFALDSDISRFAILKMCLTGASVALLVLLSGYRFFRVLRVEFLLYAVLAAYLALISYETFLLNKADFTLF